MELTYYIFMKETKHSQPVLNFYKCVNGKAAKNKFLFHLLSVMEILFLWSYTCTVYSPAYAACFGIIYIKSLTAMENLYTNKREYENVVLWEENKLMQLVTTNLNSFLQFKFEMEKIPENELNFLKRTRKWFMFHYIYHHKTRSTSKHNKTYNSLDHIKKTRSHVHKFARPYSHFRDKL